MQIWRRRRRQVRRALNLRSAPTCRCSDRCRSIHALVVRGRDDGVPMVLSAPDGRQGKELRKNIADAMSKPHSEGWAGYVAGAGHPRREG